MATQIEILRIKHVRLLSKHSHLKRTCDKDSLVIDPELDRVAKEIDEVVKEMRVEYNKQYRNEKKGIPVV